MSQSSTGRNRMLILAFSVHPHKNMEDRNGWHRSIQAARDFDVVVMCSPTSNADELRAALPDSLRGKIEYVPVRLGWFNEYCLTNELLFYRGYRSWLWKAKKLAIVMHAKNRFQLSHLVSLCGFREPGYLWQLDFPSILGPIGGTTGFKRSYLSMVDFRGGLFEVARNLINCYQSRFSRRIHQAIEKSSVVIAANTSTRDDLQHYSKRWISVKLETGIDYPILNPKPKSSVDQPLQILWCGRLRAWKALPLLLHAVAKLPEEMNVNIRIVGDGKCELQWKRIARNLKIDDQIEWIKRPHYRESLKYYRDADVFAFTSLRDTSGTGLLEALSAGTPIIALNHQGAADIITNECGIPVSVHSPNQSIQEIRDAIVSLYNDRNLLKKLSDGALYRARDFQWHNYEESMLLLYKETANIR